MPLLILGIIILGIVSWVFDTVSAAFNAIGGWPSVIAIVVGGVVLMTVLGRRHERAQELEELKGMPGQVLALVKDASNLFGKATETLNQAKAQFEERRAPLFWDKVDDCEKTLAQCVDRLGSAQELIESYNERAPTRDLTDPAQITPLPPAVYNDTNALIAEISDCSYQAMAVAEFGVVYEQRRQAQLIVEEQRRVRSEMRSKLNALEAKTSEAIEVAKKAVSKAETAKRIGKEARGDWF